LDASVPALHPGTNRDTVYGIQLEGNPEPGGLELRVCRLNRISPAKDISLVHSLFTFKNITPQKCIFKAIKAVFLIANQLNALSASISVKTHARC